MDKIIRVSKWNKDEESPFSGYLKLFDTVNETWIKGYFVNGVQEGKCIETDKNGTIVFEGFYKNGVKQKLKKMKEMKGYWKEIDDDDSDYV